MIRPLFTSFFAILLLLVLSCKSSSKTLSSSMDLEGEWTIIEAMKEDAASLMEDKKATIGFRLEDSSFYGYAGCNRIFGSISRINDGEILFGTTGSTKRMCPNMNVELLVLKALNKIEKFYFEADGTLVFKDKEDNIVLKAVKK